MRFAERQVSRTALSWLLILQVAVLIPISFQLPVWLLGISACCWGWRLAIFRGMVSPPGRFFSGLVVVLSVGLVVVLEGRLASLKGFALLLTFGFIFKLVELRNLRDAFAVLLLAILLLGVNLLFSQNLGTSILTAASMLVILAAWIGLSYQRPVIRWRQPLQLAGSLFVLALPITVALFLFIPRIPPVWQISANSGAASTGISDSISPGDVANLIRSDELAFRVSFEGNRLPLQHELYWRSVVMTEFDGRAWKQNNTHWFGRDDFNSQSWAKVIHNRESRWISWPSQPRPWSHYQKLGMDYSVIVEASQQHWLPALANPRSETKDIGLVADGRLIYRRPLLQRIQYDVSSAIEPSPADISLRLAEYHRAMHLAFPKASNQRMQIYAQNLWQQDPVATQFIGRFLRTIQQNYHYTLRPPLLGEDAIDEFWFDHKAGFCSHYASALAFALRVVGVPSRVIGGYQGGEWDAQANYLQVRQYDAHAWVEYWDEQKGWTKVDPTAAIAPERIEMSFAEQMRSRSGSDLDVMSWRFSNNEWLIQMRQRWDRLEYLWHQSVLNYKQKQQLELLKNWFGTVNWQQISIGLVAGITLFLTAVLLWNSRFWQKPKRPPQVLLYREFLQKLMDLGVDIDISVPPGEILSRISALTESRQQVAKRFIAAFVAIEYQPEQVITRQQLKELRALLQSLGRRRRTKKTKAKAFH